jgi:C1A family cysteine protease
MPKINETSIGGHDQVIVGWDKTLDFGNGIVGGFKVRNSWGSDVFQSGYEWIPFAYFDSSLNYVFDSFVVMKDDTIVVSPTTNKNSNGFLSLIFAFLKSLFYI